MESIPSSFSVIYGLLILLPGFITLFVERLLSYQRQDIGAIFIAKALVYSFINYSLFSVTGLSLISWTIRVTSAQTKEITINPMLFAPLIMLVISVTIGLLIGLLKTKDWHMRFARGIGLTRRTSRTSIWLDIFHDKYSRKKEKEHPRDGSGAYVSVFLKDGRQLYGWPEYFSDDFHDGPILFLTKAAWISEEGNETKIPYPGILLNGSQVKFIQFYMA
ncbi:MAG: DUF6338 family protein [Candidatus Zixiibacteriota bacterium]